MAWSAQSQRKHRAIKHAARVARREQRRRAQPAPSHPPRQTPTAPRPRVPLAVSRFTKEARREDARRRLARARWLLIGSAVFCLVGFPFWNFASLAVEVAAAALVAGAELLYWSSCVIRVSRAEDDLPHAHGSGNDEVVPGAVTWPRATSAAAQGRQRNALREEGLRQFAIRQQERRDRAREEKERRAADARWKEALMSAHAMPPQQQVKEAETEKRDVERGRCEAERRERLLEQLEQEVAREWRQ